jgi:hypothetical protein
VDESLLLVVRPLSSHVSRLQPEVLPEYHGPNLKGVRVETDIFEGMKFGRNWFLFHFIILTLSLSIVVMSDPKSRTGEQDKKDLMTLSVVYPTTAQAMN